MVKPAGDDPSPSQTGPSYLFTFAETAVSANPPAPMSRKKISTTIYITPEQNDRLKLLHERTKVPIAVYIREGIDMVLKHYEHILPGQMSLEAASGQKKS
jgi:predicted DNA-binding protein